MTARLFVSHEQTEIEGTAGSVEAQVGTYVGEPVETRWTARDDDQIRLLEETPPG